MTPGTGRCQRPANTRKEGIHIYNLHFGQVAFLIHGDIIMKKQKELQIVL